MRSDGLLSAFRSPSELLWSGAIALTQGADWEQRNKKKKGKYAYMASTSEDIDYTNIYRCVRLRPESCAFAESTQHTPTKTISQVDHLLFRLQIQDGCRVLPLSRLFYHPPLQRDCRVSRDERARAGENWCDESQRHRLSLRLFCVQMTPEQLDLLQKRIGYPGNARPLQVSTERFSRFYSYCPLLFPDCVNPGTTSP